MKKLFLIIFLFSSPLLGEDPPPPEYPYPKNFKKKRSKIPEVEKPINIDNRGVYYYSKKRKKKKEKIPDTIERPHKVGSDGSYHYSTKERKRKLPPRGVEKPKSVNSKGEFIYHDENAFEFNGILSILGGYYKIPKTPFVFEKGYRDLYSQDQPLPFWPFLIRIDYEQRLVDSLFMKMGTGMTGFRGWLSDNDKIKESSRFYLFPTILSLSYKLSFWDIQYFTPYVDAGMGYLIESRKTGDDKKRKYHRHPVSSLGLGVLIPFSKFQCEKSPLNEYGITQTWFDIQYRKIIDSKNCHDSTCRNFTSDMITAGFAFGFGETRRKTVKNHDNKPSAINRDGGFIYKNNKTLKTAKILSLLAGTYGPPDIQPTREGGLDYHEIYSDKKQFVFRFEYDWKLFDFEYDRKRSNSVPTNVGSVSLKLGSGLTQVRGTGRFVNPQKVLEPRESFNFYLLPTTLSLSYKLSLWDTQYFTPYVDVGMGYFGFIERRSDGKKTRYGGAPVSVAGLGMLVSLSKFQNGILLLNEYGITQIWLNFQYQKVIGLNSRKDFTSDMTTGGFAFGF